MSKRVLQTAVAIASLVPIGAGAAGVILGPRMFGAAAAVPPDLDSHFRYLSGLLLAIGIGFVSTIPGIETHGRRFWLLAGIVMVGGAARLLSLLSIGPPSLVTIFALVMELLVTPGLAVWRQVVAYRTARA